MAAADQKRLASSLLDDEIPLLQPKPTARISRAISLWVLRRRASRVRERVRSASMRRVSTAGVFSAHCHTVLRLASSVNRGSERPGLPNRHRTSRCAPRVVIDPGAELAIHGAPATRPGDSSGISALPCAIGWHLEGGAPTAPAYT